MIWFASLLLAASMSTSIADIIDPVYVQPEQVHIAFGGSISAFRSAKKKKIKERPDILASIPAK